MAWRTRIRAIAIGGFVAGTCDIVYAILFYGRYGASPSRVLQSVASGLLGAAAYDGGTATAAVGLALHYLIAFILATTFVVLATRFPVLVQRVWLWGSVYGFAVYWMMNLVVLPLSAFPRKVSFPLLPTATGLVVHVVLIGLPIALAARAALTDRPASSSAAG